MLSDLNVLSILSPEIPLDLHDSVQVVPLKYLIYLLAGINAKQNSNIPKEKYFTVLRMLNLFVESFVNLFVDTALNFLDKLFNSFLFNVISFSLLSKSVFFTKLAVSLLLAKYCGFSLAVKLSNVNLLYSWLVIYLS